MVQIELEARTFRIRSSTSGLPPRLLGYNRGSAKPSANGRYRAQLRQQGWACFHDFRKAVRKPFNLSAIDYRLLEKRRLAGVAAIALVSA